MPFIDAEYAKRDILERKLKFLEKHPPLERAQLKAELDDTKKQWDEYQKSHKTYAQIAKSITVIRSDHYKASKMAFQKAAEKYAKLEAESKALGIGENETQANIKSDIEVSKIKQNLLVQLSYDVLKKSCLEEGAYFHRMSTVSNIQRAIQENPVLIVQHRQELLSEVEKIAQDTEQRLFLKYEFPSFDHERLKNWDFSARRALFEGLQQRLGNYGFELSQQQRLRLILDEKYEQLEKQFFLEQDLKNPELTKTEYTRLINLITQRYDYRENLCRDLMQQTKLLYEKTEKKMLREQELEPILKRAKLELSYQELIDLSPEEREKKFKLLCGELGKDYTDVVYRIRNFYNEVIEKINLTSELDKQLLWDWEEEALKKEPEDYIEGHLNQKLDAIRQILDENDEIRNYLHLKVEEIGQRAIWYHRIQQFSVHLWSLKTMSERQKSFNEFESSIPLVIYRNELSNELRMLHRYTEAKIQLVKMEESLKKMEKVLLDLHKESQMDVPFQEAEINFDKLGLKRHRTGGQVEEERLVDICNKLREKHALILEENRFIRAAVEDLGALQQLSFEAQERAMPWIAGKWFKVLRTEQLLNMLGVQRLLPFDEGNLSVGSVSYQLSPFQVLLVKSYIEEALKQFRVHSGEGNWLSYQVKQELDSVQKQIC